MLNDTDNKPHEHWDAIVIGSGIGGLACAAALAKTGHQVLVLERHSVPGGLSQTFSRGGFMWDVGLHYLGQYGPEGSAGKLLQWLSNGQIKMAPMGAVYDTLHFPGGFEITLSPPEARLKLGLKEKFPASSGEIERYFEAVHKACDAAMASWSLRMMPAPLAAAYRWWKQKDIERWCGRTTSEVIAEIVRDTKLAAVLCAQSGDSGGAPKDVSFAIHAVVVSSYFDGAYYPVGGARVLSEGLVPVIKAQSGAVLVNNAATQLVIENGVVVGVKTANGEEHLAKHVVSDIGVRETVNRLLPPEMQNSEWAREILSLQPNVCHFALYLGFEGDIRAGGATVSNHWINESWDIDEGIWSNPHSQPVPPTIFVSFPSLKDPSHVPGVQQRHTGEVITWIDWNAVALWADRAPAERGSEYADFKTHVEQCMLEQFARYFPGLAPMVKYHELSTPLTTVAFTGHEKGSSYGLETTPRRMLSRALNAKTPIRGLYLAGQDVVSPGITGAMFGGAIAAANIDPRVLQHIS
ncbi:MAG: phytoene desaturase family protein [Gallionellaceae bacterium]